MSNEYVLTKKSKICYSTGCIGRDMNYTMVSLFIMTYLLYGVGLEGKQLLVATIIMFATRIWDAVNDPMMSTIITNSHFKKGKYRPWVLIGGLTNVLALILMFSTKLTGWSYVIFFGFIYLVWESTFTMNDVGYWSMLPALAKEKKSRDQLTTLVALCASIGAFLAGGLIPVLTTGNVINMYRAISIVIAIVFALCQVMVYFCVKEPVETKEDLNEEKTTLKDMVKIIFSDKQVLWMSVVVLLYSLGSALLNAFGINYFYFEFGYEPMKVTIFTAIYAAGTLISQMIYPMLAKKFTRSSMVKVSLITSIVGYVLFFILGGSIIQDNSVKFAILCAIGVAIFAGQGIFYLNMLIMLANTIEYNQYNTNQRNESIIFATRPFMVKFASAIQAALLSLVLLVTNLDSVTKKINNLEVDRNKGLITDTELFNQAKLIVSNISDSSKLWYRLSMTLLPILLFAGCYYISQKKYIIDEKLYDKIIRELEEREVKTAA